MFVNDSNEKIVYVGNREGSHSLYCTLAGVTCPNPEYRMLRYPSRDYIFEYVISGSGYLEYERDGEDIVEKAGIEKLAGYTSANPSDFAKVTARFPNAPIHYDGPVSEETLPKITALLKNNPLTVWIPLECKRTGWCTMPKATPELCAMAKRYGQLGLWILETEEQLAEARQLGADIIETTGALKP